MYSVLMYVLDAQAGLPGRLGWNPVVLVCVYSKCCVHLSLSVVLLLDINYAQCFSKLALSIFYIEINKFTNALRRSQVYVTIID